MRGRTQSNNDPVSLDVYQQLLAKMREKAAKDGVSAEEAAQASARASADIEVIGFTSLICLGKIKFI